MQLGLYLSHSDGQGQSQASCAASSLQTGFAVFAVTSPLPS